MGKKELSKEKVKVLKDLEEHVKILMEEGLYGLPYKKEKPESLEKAPVKSTKPDKHKLLEKLKKEVENCRKCEISKFRTNIVFGEGSPDTPVMFVGEAPGEEEDLQGRPFVGKAGKLLEMALNSLGWDRSKVYIANILKCRPPKNRNPLPHEIENCLPYLKKQIEIIKPRIICTLGSYSTLTLLGRKDSISKLRGKLHDYMNIKIFPTFHPAFILRNPSMKRTFFEDLKRLKEMVEGS